ncbi:TlpA family protein disulfide reductase [Spongiimicrobium salis]|uniref:TlpA family protein disulfide reductase n=1 Tax=Spongiimicrobium salis TaxID=1667022 RepID=UPI00374DD170
MRKHISTLFAVFIGLSLYANSGKVILSGQVQQPAASSIMITYLDNQELISAELNANGNFKMSADIEEGYYLLEYGRNTAYLYLYPQDEFKIVFNAKDFENTLVYSGKGALRNNYLAKKAIMDTELTKDLEAFYATDEAVYLKNIEGVKNAHLTALSKYDVPQFFRKAEQKSLEYERLLSIQNYKSNIKFYLGKEIAPSAKFYQPIANLGYSDADYKKQPYYRYLMNSIWSKRIDAAPDVDRMLNVLRKVPSEALAITLINGCYSKISSHKERAADYLNLIKRVTTYQPFIEAAEQQYKEVMHAKGLRKGDASPGFRYESIDGKIVSLSDLKGKYVYIDVWTTWCAPCIKQIPYLKELEEHYKGKNIVFVSISVDKEEVKPTWKQMVKEKQLGGLQLFADKSFDSAFMNAFAVNSIPRFIVIDPEGKIVNPVAPRPSFEKTKTLLNTLLQ